MIITHALIRLCSEYIIPIRVSFCQVLFFRCCSDFKGRGDLDITQTTQAAEDIILPNSKQADFAVTENGVLLTDPKRGVIWGA